MKKEFKLLLYTLTVFSTLSLRSISEEDFVNKHIAPQDVIDKLKKHTKFFHKINAVCSKRNCRRKFRHLVWKFNTLPNYYVKRNISRIRGREIINACIQENNLDRLTIPKKYLYHVPGTGTELNDNNYWVIVEEVLRSSAPLLITLEVAEQICTLIRCAGYMDFKQSNIIQTRDNKIALIDSETIWVKGAEKKCPGLEIIFIYTTFNVNTSFTKDALKHILTQISECEPLSKERYQRILKRLKKQPKPRKWDYVSFYKNLYPQFSKQQ